MTVEGEPNLEEIEEIEADDCSRTLLPLESEGEFEVDIGEPNVGGRGLVVVGV